MSAINDTEDVVKLPNPKFDIDLYSTFISLDLMVPSHSEPQSTLPS